MGSSIMIQLALLVCFLVNFAAGAVPTKVASGCHRDGGANLLCPNTTEVSLVGAEYYYAKDPNICGGGGCGLLYHKNTLAGDKMLVSLSPNCSDTYNCTLNPAPIDLPAYCGAGVKSKFILITFKCKTVEVKDTGPRKYPKPAPSGAAYIAGKTPATSLMVAITTMIITMVTRLHESRIWSL